MVVAVWKKYGTRIAEIYALRIPADMWAGMFPVDPTPFFAAQVFDGISDSREDDARWKDRRLEIRQKWLAAAPYPPHRRQPEACQQAATARPVLHSAPRVLAAFLLHLRCGYDRPDRGCPRQLGRPQGRCASCSSLVPDVWPGCPHAVHRPAPSAIPSAKTPSTRATSSRFDSVLGPVPLSATGKFRRLMTARSAVGSNPSDVLIK